MKVKIITTTPEIVISDSAKICYNAKHDRDITSQLVHKQKHLAVLRMAFAVLEVSGVSRACIDQFTRSSHLNFLVQSMRYVDAENFEFIYPDEVGKDGSDVMTEHWRDTLKRYRQLRQLGYSKEDARAILPMNTSSACIASGNLQAWMDFFRLRLESHAQKEIRDMAYEIYTQLAQKFPQVFTLELLEELQK